MTSLFAMIDKHRRYLQRYMGLRESVSKMPAELVATVSYEELLANPVRDSKTLLDSQRSHTRVNSLNAHVNRWIHCKNWRIFSALSQLLTCVKSNLPLGTLPLSRI